MKPFSAEEHRDALVRRRIKFVVEKGAMASLFRAGTSSELQEELFHRLKSAELAGVQTRQNYDDWLTQTVELDCWQKYSRNGLEVDRWAYFAKLISIVVYEIVSNRELFTQADWLRIQPFLHLPIVDWRTVTHHLSQIEPTFPMTSLLKGMTKEEYWHVQEAVRKLAESHNVPPIWFEAAWSA